MPIKKKSIPSKSQKQSLKEARLKLEYYETLFSLAKEEYGFDLKKILASSGIDSKQKK